MRVCGVPGCPTISEQPRCPEHTPTTTQRDYGTKHQRQRKRIQPIIDRGQGRCAEYICLEQSRLILPGAKWHLAHTADRMGYLGPAHPRCNDAAAGRMTAQ